ncbi:MAG: putative DNA binding domain-containing protein [Oscillospiraceae bacterium]|nr:putative DNA binding domain-containing protein [Oscillospiraceae bacterium]
MEEVLSLIQRAKNSILLGESHFREFKTALEGKPGQKRPRRVAAICSEIGEALVAFANADGGELFVGVEDDGTITGLDHNENDIQTMLNAINTHILDAKDFPIQINSLLNIDEKLILFFSVTKSIHKIYQLPDGRCMRRQDKSSMPASIEKIQYERRESLSRGYDREFVDDATVKDLDISIVQQMADGLLRGMSPEQYLQQVNLAEYGIGGIRLRRAAVLLFAKDITKWFPRCQIRILKVNGDEVLPGDKYNVISDDYITGNIFYLLSAGWERLRPFLSQKTVFGEGATFEQLFSYPENACREALVNAIAHRDYSVSNPVTIYIYDNRLSFESPGELLSTIDINDLRKGTGVHESRNNNIARVLRENKLMRELGEGIRRIFDLLKAQELAPPQIESTQGCFTISMNHQSIYSEREQMWLSLFAGYNLDQYQKRIVIAGIDGRKLSPSMIYSALGSNDRNLYDRSVTTLRITGILKEINTAAYATKEAKKTGKQKQDIPRFAVTLPDNNKSDSVSNKVYVYGLTTNIDEITLKKEMSLFGPVINIKLPLDQTTGQIHGFAFIEYADSNSALKAIAIKNIKVNECIANIIPYKRYKKGHYNQEKRGYNN